MRTHLSRSLQVLDESFQLYRSHFVTFTILAALFVVPVIVIILSFRYLFANARQPWELLGLLSSLLLT